MGGRWPTDDEKAIEATAQHFAMMCAPWDSVSRSRIRRRVQELLRCEDKDEGVASGARDLHDRAIWDREAIRVGIERALVSPLGLDSALGLRVPELLALIVQRTKDAIRKEFGIAL